MSKREAKLRIMDQLLPYFDMFEAGAIADQILSEFMSTGKRKFDVRIGAKKTLEITLHKGA